MKSQSILSRLLRAFCSSDDSLRRALIAVHPEPRDLEAARKLQFLVSMQDTFAAKKQGKLTNLSVTVQRGMVVMTGRFREKDLARLLGKDNLPVIMVHTRLARVIMISCHEEDHRRTAADTLARSRNHVWIPHGTRLAKSVTKSCMKCRLAAKKTVDQIMGKLP